MENNYPLKLWIYTFCYNEEETLPYIIAYWKQYATKVIVYDNGSTDNSLKILSQYSWIEVREFNTENTFDPEKISQYKSFCYADAIGKADYVMVCDIDEVLLPTENLFPELVLAKKDNVQVFQTKYYEIINNELDSKYDSLIHTAEEYYAYPNPNIHKAIVFDPRIKIAFGYNSLTYSTNRNYITKSIITLHLKMISNNILISRQKNLYLRLNKKYQDDALYYGNVKNIGTRLSYFKLLFPHKYRFNKNENYITVFDDIYTITKNSIKFKDLTWLPTKINHNSKSSNKECIFGIPIYKSDLTTTEKASLTQLCKIIQNKFEICLICPEDLNLREYIDIADKYEVKLSTLFCAKQYFIGTASYSYMCETADFYKCFSEYKYLFIYQLDGWIFEDNVQKYLDLDVDYIGSPWNVGSFNLQCDTIGNGGVSLRKVQKFIDVCNSFTPEDYEKDLVKTEDLFFCKTMRTKVNFKLPTVQIGSNFSLCGLWGRFMTKYNDGKLPMCLHAWYRDYSTYWKKYINLDDFETTGDIKIVQQPTQSAQKYDYKTRLELIKMRLNNSIKPINIQPNTKIENKKEITQKTTMSSGYSSFLASYYGIKPKNNEIKQNAYSNTQTDKQVVPANKVEENKVEEKNLEVKQEIQENVHIIKDSYLYYICESDDMQVHYSNNERIIVTMTTWPKRIGNIPAVLTNILNNTMLPYKIVINLAEEEFKNKEKDFPNSVNEFLNKHKDIIKVHWVKHNTKVWKKSIPTLLRYPNDLIICIDDDFAYPTDFIKTFFDKHNNVPNKPLTGVIVKINEGKNQHCGCSSMDSLKWCNPYVQMINKPIYETGDEDSFMTYCYYLNNIEIEYVGKRFFTNMSSINSIEGYSRTNKINCRASWKIFIKNIKKIDFLSTIYKDNKKVQIIFNFDPYNYNIDKMFCVLGVLKSCKGIQLQKDMVKWLSTKYNVISIIQEYPGELFEYPAINYAKQFSSINNCNILYLHTKGAYNSNILQNMIINLWEDEFINHYDDYLKILNTDKNVIACPFTGTKKWTWFNGFYISSNAGKNMKDITIMKDRYGYETLFQTQTNIQVIGRIYNNVDNFNNPNNKNKLLMREYIINNFNKTNINIKNYFDNNYIVQKPRIIVSLTTYPKRINNVAISIKLLLTKQTIKPNEIHLWLSIEEFKNKENDLPQQLLTIINENNNVFLHWIEKNTYVHKRHEIFKYTTDSDYVFLIDDDVEYDQKLIETVLEKAKLYPNTIITYNKYTFHEYKGRAIIYRENKGNPGPFINKTRWCGQSMIPSAIYPKDILSKENQEIRNNTSPISDECWFQPWTVYYDIPIYECPFGWGKDIDKNNTKWQGLVAWTHQKDSNGYEKRDNWLHAVLTAYPEIYKKYQNLFNYDK